MAKTCAYCRSSGPFTADHVWPRCFLDRYGQHAAHFSVRSRQVHGADYVVKDVCAICNAERLSPLDSYFCRLYDEYFVHLHDFNSTATLHYDFDLLARSLLKISYNTARQGISDSRPLAALREFIIGRDSRPMQLAIFAEIVSPTMVPQSDGSMLKVMPEMYRSALGGFLTPGFERILLRIVAVNSYYFHVMVPLEGLIHAEFEEVADQFCKNVKGAVRLPHSLKEITIRTSPQDGVRSIIPQLSAYHDQYCKFFAKKRPSQ